MSKINKLKLSKVFSFVVAGEGTVYEGRGLITEPELLDEKYRKHHGKSLDIAYLGDFTGKYHVTYLVLKGLQ